MSTRISPEQRVQMLAELDRWTREQIVSYGSFSQTGAGRHLARVYPNGGKTYNRDFLHSLIEDLGDAVQLSHRLGYGRRGVTPAGQTLATLLAIVEERFVNREHQPKRGRRPSAERDIHVVNEGQLVIMKLGAGVAAEAITGDKRRLGDVGIEHFEWGPGTRVGGAGQWRLVDLVASYSNERARQRYIREHGSEIGWSERRNAEALKKQAGGLCSLLDVAAAHGLVVRDVQPVAMRHAPEWERHLAKLIPKARRPDVSDRSLTRGARLLALYATRRGWLEPSAVDWEVVRGDIELALDRGLVKKRDRDWARIALNAMVRAGELATPPWPLANEDPITIVPRPAIEKAAATGDFSDWVTRNAELRGGEPPEIALATVGEDEWLVYTLDDTPAGDSGIFWVTLREAVA